MIVFPESKMSSTIRMLFPRMSFSGTLIFTCKRLRIEYTYLINIDNSLHQMLSGNFDKMRSDFEALLTGYFRISVKSADQLAVKAEGTIHDNQQVNLLMTSVNLVRIYTLSKFLDPLLQISFRNHYIVHIILNSIINDYSLLPYSSRSLRYAPYRSQCHP